MTNGGYECQFLTEKVAESPDGKYKLAVRKGRHHDIAETGKVRMERKHNIANHSNATITVF